MDGKKQNLTIYKGGDNEPKNEIFQKFLLKNSTSAPDSQVKIFLKSFRIRKDYEVFLTFADLRADFRAHFRVIRWKTGVM